MYEGPLNELELELEFELEILSVYIETLLNPQSAMVVVSDLKPSSRVEKFRYKSLTNGRNAEVG